MTADSRHILKKIVGLDSKVMYSLPEITNKRVLVLAPHPDDETLGCGGTICNLRGKDIKVAVLLITDGSGGGRNEGMSALRLNEFEKAMGTLGCDNKFCMGFQDGSLESSKDAFRDGLSEFIFNYNPDIIFSPYIFDINSDHVVTSLILADCIENHQNVIIAMYEIWTPMLYPNYYLNISQVFDRKLAAIRCYESQEKYYKIIDKAMYLNMLRSRLSMRRNIEYIEAFKCFSSKDYRDMVIHLREELI